MLASFTPRKGRAIELLEIAINAVVVVVVGAVLAWFGKGRFDRLDERLDGWIDRLEDRPVGRFDRLEGRFDRLEASVDALRSDLTQVALAVGVRPRAQSD